MSDWPSVRLRYLARINPPPSEVRHRSGRETVSFVPMEAVGEYGGLDLSTSKLLDDIGAGYTYFANGDVLLAKITPCFENGKGALAHALENGIGFGTSELHVLRPQACLDSKFLFYLSISPDLRNAGEREMYGAGGQKRVPVRFLQELRVRLPSLPAQQAIADFLDRKTQAIDVLIRKKERLIELLQEKRQALITHAVTKGLDPSVPMKDSGVEWLGEIPAHWKVLPLKRISPKQHGRLIVSPNRYIEDEGIPIVFGFNIRNGKIDTSAIRYIGRQYEEQFRTCTVSAGDLLCVRVGAPGETAVVPPELDGCHFASAMQIVQAPSFCSEWLACVFNSSIVRFQIQLVQYGAAQEQINVQDAAQFLIPTPPRAEQIAIANMLSASLDRLGQVISNIRRQILRLREYRQSLISAAVTGQLEIPSSPTPEPAP